MLFFDCQHPNERNSELIEMVTHSSQSSSVFTQSFKLKPSSSELSSLRLFTGWPFLLVRVVEITWNLRGITFTPQDCRSHGLLCFSVGSRKSPQNRQIFHILPDKLPKQLIIYQNWCSRLFFDIPSSSTNSKLTQKCPQEATRIVQYRWDLNQIWRLFPSWWQTILQSEDSQHHLSHSSVNPVCAATIRQCVTQRRV